VTLVLDTPESFREDVIAGLLAAHPSLRRVDGAAAVARAERTSAGRVGVVVGGGGGHLPAFAGFVGPGLADAAVLGEVFTSPSTEQVLRTIEAVDAGAGVVLCIGNYNGDVMNFGMAAARARRDGRDVRLVAFTDDIASAQPSSVGDRRGIAGGWFAVRALGAAAAGGAGLDAVEAAGRHAVDRTRSLGVAFGGCTLPGAAGPLFTVPDGAMGIGLGIHGEAGVGEGPVLGATALAELLVERVVAERPDGAHACATLVNGLGGLSLEELYVLHGRVARRLDDLGVAVESALVGQVVTSIAMPGCSLSVCWLDDELRRWLDAPFASPMIPTGR
jgi:dihydroxyacetone kinase